MRKGRESEIIRRRVLTEGRKAATRSAKKLGIKKKTGRSANVREKERDGENRVD